MPNDSLLGEEGGGFPILGSALDMGRFSVAARCVGQAQRCIDLTLPYVAAHILLDGADIPFFSLVQEVDAENVRMGMRVEAVWAPREEWGTTFANIRYFKPLDEPDVPYEQFKEHL